MKPLPSLTEDPVEVSSRIIDSGVLSEAFNRVSQKVSGITDDISIVESFSHMISFKTEDGLVSFDASGAATGGDVVSALRTWSTEPVANLVYTHGHIDHVGGSGAVAADAADRDQPAPEVVAHTGVRDRFERYQATNGWNNSINARQFGGVSKKSKLSIGGQETAASERKFLPDDTLWPDLEFSSSHKLHVGGTEFQLFHDKGETDDHTWAWIPQHKALCAGDFVTWVFPNCGNPQKVQRFPAEWAAALRKMDQFGAEWLFGAHGLPVHGAERVHLVLDSLATALETLVETTVAMMNQGESLDAIIHEISLPPEMIRPWMLPVYDEPEFVVRNIWRLYGGWWDLNPANLKPAPADAIAAEVVSLSGGVDRVVDRAMEVAESGDLKLACHLIEYAASAAPDSVSAHRARREIYQMRRDGETSLMSKGIFSAAANESGVVVDGGPPARDPNQPRGLRLND